MRKNSLEITINERKLSVINLMIRKKKKKKEKVVRDNLEAGEKIQIRKKYLKKRKMDKRLKTWSHIFNNVQIYIITDFCILTTSGFRLIEKDF